MFIEKITVCKANTGSGTVRTVHFSVLVPASGLFNGKK